MGSASGPADKEGMGETKHQDSHVKENVDLEKVIKAIMNVKMRNKESGRGETRTAKVLSIIYEACQEASLVVKEQKVEEIEIASPTFGKISETESTWSCIRCTLNNPFSQPVCVACGGSRARSMELHSPEPTKVPSVIINLIQELENKNIGVINAREKEEQNGYQEHTNYSDVVYTLFNKFCSIIFLFLS